MSEAKAPKKKTYLELLAERQELDKLMDAAKAEELAVVIADMKEKISLYSITAEQLGFLLEPVEPPQKPRKSRTKSDKPAKPIEKDEFGNYIRRLEDGSMKSCSSIFDPANPNQKAYKDGKRKGWLQKLIDAKVPAATYTIK